MLIKIVKSFIYISFCFAFLNDVNCQSIYHDDWIDFNKNGLRDTYENSSSPTDQRVSDLISQMNVNEKTCQLATLYGFGRVLTDELPTEEWNTKIWKDGIANIDEHLNGLAYHPKAETGYSFPYSKHAEALNTVQRWFVEKTRLGIPVDFTNEGIRGLCHDRATSFPSQIGIGSTWDKTLVRKIGEITGREARALGYTNIYSPILDLARDPRWGRTVECYGEDPYLVGSLGLEMVKALQKQSVVSTPKHFAVYSVPKGGRDGDARTDPHVAPREMQQMYLAPFRKAFTEGKAMGVMSSYNDWDGIPITASDYFLRDILRDEWGFEGYVVSDSRAVEYLVEKHRTAKDQKEAVLQAAKAGLNVRTDFSPPEDYILPMRALLKEGALSMEIVDSLVADVLRVKFRLGLFDDPYTDASQANAIVRSADAIETSLEASRKSMVLLKNIDQFLPITRKKGLKILVTGPNATEITPFISRYGPSNFKPISMLKGIQDAAGPKVQISYAEGCLIYDEHWPQSELYPHPITQREQAMIAEAVVAAKNMDMVIVVLGDNEETVGESRSRTSLELPGNQMILLQELYATGIPICLVLVNGRPATVNWADAHIPAIVETWFQGEFGGKALGEILFGDFNPSGKLPITFPKTVGQVPFNFPYKPGSQSGQPGQGPNGKGKTRNLGALYPFGHGLSYTTFAYSDLVVEINEMESVDEIKITATIQNTGKKAGSEIAQLYISDETSSVITYAKNLRGFERVYLEPNQKEKVTFILKSEDLQLLDQHMNWVVEPGVYSIFLGSSSEDIRLTHKFELK